MAFKFKKQVFGFMDLLRFKKMVPKRRENSNRVRLNRCP